MVDSFSLPRDEYILDWQGTLLAYLWLDFSSAGKKEGRREFVKMKSIWSWALSWIRAR
jgi:hypothetical protein